MGNQQEDINQLYKRVNVLEMQLKSLELYMKVSYDEYCDQTSRHIYRGDSNEHST